MDGLAEMLAELRGKSVKILAPKKGPRAELVQMATRQREPCVPREGCAPAKTCKVGSPLCKTRLRLPALARAHRVRRRLAHWRHRHRGRRSSRSRTASPTQALPQLPREARLGRRRLQRDVRGAVATLSARRDGEAGWDLPDLLVVDGGRGQLNVAQQALRDLGVEGLPIAALAKEKPNVLGEKLVDRVYLPGHKNPIELRENHAALGILALARDEAHRASNALRIKLGKRRRIKSRLDEVPGIGPKTRTRLLKAFGSVRAIEEADAAALRAAGATHQQAAVHLAHVSRPDVAERSAASRQSLPCWNG